MQRAAGIEDSPAAMHEYYMTLNQWNLQPSIVRRLAHDSAQIVEWLVGIGVEFRPDKLYCAGVESVPRGHMTEGAGYTLFQHLEQAASRRGVESVMRTRAERILTDGRGSAIGVRAGDHEVGAGAVVIACGGFGNDPDLVRAHYPSVAMHGDWVCYFGCPHNRGDGMRMGQALGAAIAGHDRGSAILTPNFSPLPDAYLPGWLVLVNRDGRRFMDETAPYAVMDGLVNRQPGSHCFAILDEAARLSARPDPSITDPLQLGDTMAYNWVADTIAQQVELGRVRKADDLDSLAAQTGIAPGVFRTTIDTYNADIERGADSRFLKAFRPLRPVATPPFYAIELRAASFAITGTGLRIDDEARVLDLADRPIAGLYAAGESAGGVYGDRYYAGGSSLGAALVFGRVAGRNAASLARGSRA
jgi:fumarate reductase flavoprotein subunit